MVYIIFKSYAYPQIRGDIHIIFFLFLHKNICCLYSLEAPCQGTSNEYKQHMFLWPNKNISIFFDWKRSALSGAMHMTFSLTYRILKNWSIQHHTVFTLNIEIPKLLTVLILKLNKITMCWKPAQWVANGITPDQTPHYVVSDLGLHSLHRSIRPKI